MDGLVLKDDALLFLMAEALTDWYSENARELPWRRDKDPYRIWLSEIMLQQTRVDTVIPYYERFLAAFPDVRALAEAGGDTLLKLWEGLGYYSRARNLSAAAKKIAWEFDGVFPDAYAGIRALPGIGDYTAGAIASICFGLPEPAVDGNVLRVYARLFELRDSVDEPKTKRSVRDALARVYAEIPAEQRGDLTQALMELGALVCAPNGAPDCAACPVRALCRARQKGTAEALPVRAKKAEKREEIRTVFILRRDGQLALRRRPEKGLLAGLWELPNVAGTLNPAKAKEQLAAWGLAPVSVQPGSKRTHTFTHIRWRMTSYVAICAPGDARDSTEASPATERASDQPEGEASPATERAADQPAGEALPGTGRPLDQSASEAFVWVSPEELAARCALPTAFAGFLPDQ